MNESPSTPGSPRLPTITRFIRWLFSRSLLGCALVGLAGLITLLVLVCTEENWRGKRAWERYKHELAAQGEKLDLQAYIPPPVPDEQNFAMTAFLAPLFDFNPEPLKEGQSRWLALRRRPRWFGHWINTPQSWKNCAVPASVLMPGLTSATTRSLRPPSCCRISR